MTRPSPLSLALTLVALVGAALFAVGLALDAHGLRLLAKPWPVVALAVWVWRTAPSGPYRRLVILGLGASLLGDLLLELSPRTLFIPGLLAFLVAHLLYIGAYVSDARVLHLLRALPAYAYAALALLVLGPGLGPMAIPVGVYTLVICTMLWRAGARLGHVEPASERLALVGALVFAASDSMIAAGRFGGHLLPEALRTGLPLRVAIMTTYWLGQWGIAASAQRNA